MLNLLGEAGGAAPTQAKIQAALQVRLHSTHLCSNCTHAPWCVDTKPEGASGARGPLRRPCNVPWPVSDSSDACSGSVM